MRDSTLREIRNVNRRAAFSTDGLLFLIACSASLLFVTSGGVSISEGAVARPHSYAQLRAGVRQGADYEVVLLAAPVPLTDSEGQGVGGGQTAGAGRIPGSAAPHETHAVFWPRGGGDGVDLHPPEFRHSAALDTDGRRQVGHGNGPPTGFARHAVLWQGSAAAYVDLHPAGVWNDSVARAVAGDQQVGNINNYFYTTYERVIVEHAALWRGSAASVVDLHPSGIGCRRSYANDTDGRRQVGYGYFPTQANKAPYRALLWSGTAASAVVLHPPGFTHSFAEGGGGDEQVGYAFDAQSGGGTRALLWRGTASSAVSLHPAGYVATSALATNGSAQVGFGSTPADAPHSHALLWSGTAESVRDLHSLLSPEFARGSSVARDIDAEGNVVGLAQRPDGSTVAVLWRRNSRAPTTTPAP